MERLDEEKAGTNPCLFLTQLIHRTRCRLSERLRRHTKELGNPASLPFLLPDISMILPAMYWSWIGLCSCQKRAGETDTANFWRERQTLAANGMDKNQAMECGWKRCFQKDWPGRPSQPYINPNTNNPLTQTFWRLIFKSGYWFILEVSGQKDTVNGLLQTLLCCPINAIHTREPRTVKTVFIVCLSMIMRLTWTGNLSRQRLLKIMTRVGAAWMPFNLADMDLGELYVTLVSPGQSQFEQMTTKSQRL